MPLPEFNKLQQNKNAVPDWAKDLSADEFISYEVTYKTKIYFDLFDEYVSPEGMTYYVYDPVKHGGDSSKKYPALMWLHGMSNATDGIKCIMCCGAEQYASPKYQLEMGGAYLIVPLAFEKRQADGSITGSWGDENYDYSPILKGIFDAVQEKNKNNMGKKFVMGASAGGFMTWKMLEDYGNYFGGAIPIASGYIPDDKSLDKISESGVSLLIAHGRHDEMADFSCCIAPREEKLKSLKNCLCFFPEWVYNGDGGVASIDYGVEMGQHCMINWVQHNLMFDSGKPADERLPRGVTGWIAAVESVQ